MTLQLEEQRQRANINHERLVRAEREMQELQTGVRDFQEQAANMQ